MLEVAMTTLRRLVSLTLTAALCIMGSACSTDSPIAPVATGKLVGVDTIGYYSKGRVQAIVDSVLDVFLAGGTMPASGFRGQLEGAQQGVQLYKIAYSSVVPEMNNKAVTAYGLVAIPDNVQPGAPILSYQHGTVWSHEWSPTYPDGSMETQFVLSQFASQGYIVIMADYFGVTPGSDLPNSYCIMNSTAQACSDMLEASKEFLQQKNLTHGKLFLHGWSQGGFSTDVFLRHLQEQNVSVAAAVTASGPSDAFTFVRKMAIEPPSTQAPFAVGIASSIVFAYDQYHSLNGYARAAVKPAYYEYARAFYNLEMSYQEFFSKIPLTFDSLYTQQFLDDAKAGTAPFWQALKNANVYDFQVRCPYRAYYSNRDEFIFPEVSCKIVEYQKNFPGSTAEAIEAAPNADHRAVYIISLIKSKPWFDSMK
jgi:hypothetical protein